MLKPAGWGGQHPGQKEWGLGQVAGQRPGNPDTRTPGGGEGEMIDA